TKMAYSSTLSMSRRKRSLSGRPAERSSLVISFRGTLDVRLDEALAAAVVFGHAGADLERTRGSARDRRSDPSHRRHVPRVLHDLDRDVGRLGILARAHRIGR